MEGYKAPRWGFALLWPPSATHVSSHGLVNGTTGMWSKPAAVPDWQRLFAGVVTNVSGVVGGSPKVLVRCAGVPRDFGRMAMLDALIWIDVQAGFMLQ